MNLYFARTSRYKVDKINFVQLKDELEYTCNTISILVVNTYDFKN